MRRPSGLKLAVMFLLCAALALPPTVALAVFTCGAPSPEKQKGTDLYTDHPVPKIPRQQKKIISRFFSTLGGDWRGTYVRIDCVDGEHGLVPKESRFVANVTVTWTNNQILHLELRRGRAQLDIERIFYAFSDGFLREERDLIGQEAHVLLATDKQLKVYRRFGQRVAARVLPQEVITTLHRHGREFELTRLIYMNGELYHRQYWRLHRIPG